MVRSSTFILILSSKYAVLGERILGAAMNKRTRILITIVLAAVLLSAAGIAVAATNPAIVRWMTGGGGGPSAGGNVTLNGTLGQPVTGPSSGGNVTLGSGYWYGTPAERQFYFPMVVK